MYKQNRHYFYGSVFFIFGLALGLSHLLFSSADEDAPVDPVTVEAPSLTEQEIPTQKAIENTAGDKPLGLSEASSLFTPGDDAIFSREIRIKQNQGLMDALLDDGAKRRNAFNAIEALADLVNVHKIQVGQKLATEYSSDGTLMRIEMQKDFNHLIVVHRKAGLYVSAEEELSSQIITRHAAGIIDDSLFLAAQRQGLPQIVIVDLIRIFSFDVDFQREVRKGDQFEIFYERKLSEDGRRVQEGNILFARLTLSGKDIKLYRYTPQGSDFADYFHEDGQSSKKTLMKTPIEGARLSSYYGNRKHPVLGYNRMHKGVDFSAPTGTPIMAAGDGVIERSSWYGSFGNYLRIRHNGTYKTIYAHMSKYGRGIKKGVRVKQGQIIGYVGASGRVTGRHLHYEVFMNGSQVNPVTLKIPSGIKLAGEQFDEYKLTMANTNKRIAQAKSHILLTRATPETMASAE